MTKSDVEQLRGILAQFEKETIEEVLAQSEGSEVEPCKLDTCNCPDPGEELAVGSDGCVEIDDIGVLERIVLPHENFLPAHFLEEGAVVQKPVARVHTGQGLGTGFLVSASLFITNNHVIGDIATARRSKMQFNYQLDYNGAVQTMDEYSVDPDPASFYTNVPLDFTLVRLKPRRSPRLVNPNLRRFNEFEQEWTPNPFPPSPFPFPFPFPSPQPTPPSIPPIPGFPPSFPGIPSFPPTFRIYPGHRWGNLQLTANISYAKKQHINIVQHPKGRRKEVALQDNHLDKIFPNVVRYTTDTDRGSSGSPVFNNEWELIALHHAGGDRNGDVWLNNEGIRIDKIVKDLRDHFNGSTIGQAILSELGIA